MTPTPAPAETPSADPAPVDPAPADPVPETPENPAGPEEGDTPIIVLPDLTETPSESE